MNAMVPLPEEASIELRRRYDEEYRRQIALSPFTPRCIGMRNPYSNDIVKSESDYYAYVQQRVYFAIMRDMLHAHYSVLLGDARLRVSAAEERLRQEARKKLMWKRALICFSLLFAIGSAVLIPKVKDVSYEEGKASGYASGQSAGYAEGKQDGYADGASEGYSTGYREGIESSSRSAPSSSSRSASSSASSRASSQRTQSSTVYVSKNGVIHSNSSCSGMKYYTELSYSEAIERGYRLCSKCY